MNSENKNAIEIYVSFNNKDKVKQLGCKWNKERGSWMFPLDSSTNVLKKLIELKKTITLYFIKETVSDWNAKSRSDCFKIDHRFCYHVVIYSDEELFKIHSEYNNIEKLTKVKTKKLVDMFIVTGECNICLEEKDLYPDFYKCGHKICKDCFKSWDKKTCPMCRSI